MTATKTTTRRTPAPVDAPAAPTARPSRPASERRNETTHPDGAAAVAVTGCPTCKARKGAKCIRHDGARTNHVHAARMAKADTAR
jgi:hypothetical protein